MTKRSRAPLGGCKKRCDGGMSGFRRPVDIPGFAGSGAAFQGGLRRFRGTGSANSPIGRPTSEGDHLRCYTPVPSPERGAAAIMTQQTHANVKFLQQSRTCLCPPSHVYPLHAASRARRANNPRERNDARARLAAGGIGRAAGLEPEHTEPNCRWQNWPNSLHSHRFGTRPRMQGSRLEPGSRITIPPPLTAAARLVQATGALSAPGFEHRLAAVLRMLGVESAGSLVLFLMAGDYSELPPGARRRFKRAMQGPESSPISSDENDVGQAE
jgi:hypothetical protein